MLTPAGGEAAGFEPFEPVQLSALVTSDLSELALADAFGEIDEAAWYLAMSQLGATGALDSDGLEAKLEANDAALIWQAEDMNGQDWMSDDHLSYLSKSLKRKLKVTGVEGAESGEESEGVDEFFAREAGTRRDN